MNILVEGRRNINHSYALVNQWQIFELIKSSKIYFQDIPFNKGGRVEYQEGSLMMPPEMESDMPVDTYPNIPPEEMAAAEASQLPDAEMEDKYMDFVLDQSLDDDEQSYLMNALETDPKLSQIFDKVITTASELSHIHI